MRRWMKEEYVVACLRKELRKQGYKVYDKKSISMHGVDIEGRHLKHRHYIFLECKGYPTGYSEGAQRENYFLAVLGQILLRMKQENANYGVGLPDHPFYRRKILSPGLRLARRELGLWFFLVRRNGKIVRLVATGKEFRAYPARK